MFNFQYKPKNSFKYNKTQFACLSTASDITSQWNEYKYLAPLQKSTQMFNISKDWVTNMAVKNATQKRNIGKWFSYLDKEVDSFLAFSKPVSIDSNIDLYDIHLEITPYRDWNPEKSPMEVLYLLAETLEDQNIPYAIGGTLALSHYTVSRATSDIDVNIWIDTKSELKSMITVLHSISPVKILSEYEESEVKSVQHYIDKCYSEQNIMRFFWHDIKIKIFLPAYSLLRDQVRNTIQLGLPHPVTLKEVPIISKESLAIFKLWWYRDKDVSDLKMLLYMNKDIDSSDVVRGIKTLIETGGIKLRSDGIGKFYIWEKLCNEINIDPKLK